VLANGKMNGRRIFCTESPQRKRHRSEMEQALAGQLTRVMPLRLDGGARITLRLRVLHTLPSAGQSVAFPFDATHALLYDPI
jgi:hypothetical protein